jgi:serine/threonine protein kinase
MQAVAALSHPNVLAIFDTGLHDGQLFAVGELLHGQTLRDRLTTALPARKAIEIAIQIARGLAAAHAKGLVHRDLKPENIFLLEDGQVKVLDFGLVRQVGSDTAAGATQTIARTDAGIVMGTIGYMAPEQVRGQPVDARADLFALGAVLYEMMSGRRAFGRQTPADSMTAILTEEPPDLAASVVDASPAVERIVRHCLEKNPTERFQTARDVAFALESLTASARQTSSGSQPLPSAMGRQLRGRWASVRWGAAAVAGALLLTAGWFGGRATVPTAVPASATWASLAPPFGRFAPFAGPAISPDGLQVAFWAPDERQRTLL